MDINALYVTIESVLNGTHISRSFNNTNLNDFGRIYKAIRKNIEELESEADPTALPVNQVHATVCVLKNILLGAPCDKIFLEFTKAWLFLVYNWNNNTAQDVALTDDCVFMERFTDSFLTMGETIEILKHLNKFVGDMKSWTPPAFEISKAFLNYIDEDK